MTDGITSTYCEDSALISKSGLLITEYEIAAYGK